MFGIFLSFWRFIYLFFCEIGKKKPTLPTRHDSPGSALGTSVPTREGCISGGPTRVWSDFFNFGQIKPIPPHPSSPITRDTCSSVVRRSFTRTIPPCPIFNTLVLIYVILFLTPINLIHTLRYYLDHLSFYYVCMSLISLEFLMSNKFVQKVIYFFCWSSVVTCFAQYVVNRIGGCLLSLLCTTAAQTHFF
jgi:hypothetical protein